MKLTCIGVIRTPFKEQEGMPIQSIWSDATGSVEVYQSFLEGLEGVEGFSHLILLYEFHRSPPAANLMVKPFLDDQRHGVFATRHPCRPNPLGISVVRLLERRGSVLHIQGVDMLDETPLLDIKPYIPEFDQHAATRIGWYADARARHPDPGAENK